MTRDRNNERCITREQAREIDRRANDEYGLPGIVLMENAGRGAAEWLVQQGIRGSVIICCGKGNNGGDGLVIARHLQLAGIESQLLLLFAEPQEFRGDAAINLRVVQRAGFPWQAVSLDVHGKLPRAVINRLGSADWIIDALLGTGTAGEVREPYVSAIRAINTARDAGATVCAVDLPSGLDANTGDPLGVSVRANVTATFVAWKRAFANRSSHMWTGEISIIGIGIPQQLLEQFGVEASLHQI